MIQSAEDFYFHLLADTQKGGVVDYPLIFQFTVAAQKDANDMDPLAAQLPDLKAGVADGRLPNIFFIRMVPVAYHVIGQAVAENVDDLVVRPPEGVVHQNAVVRAVKFRVAP